MQSTDKNFLVPVGGAVIAAGKKDASLVDAVNRCCCCLLVPGNRRYCDCLVIHITTTIIGVETDPLCVA